jgi:hypothetical protein
MPLYIDVWRWVDPQSCFEYGGEKIKSRKEFVKILTVRFWIGICDFKITKQS